MSTSNRSAHRTARGRKKHTVANPDIRRYVSTAEALCNGQDWTARPEIPAASEIMGSNIGEEDTVDLPPNVVDGPWPSTQEYLRTHYELLREDSVALLRDAVAYVRENPSMTDTSDTCIYDKVYFVGLTFASKGLALKIQFSTARARKNIVWDYSTRLLPGSLVALTPARDCFKTTCVVATIAARPLDQVKQIPHQVDIYVATIEDTPLDPQQEWIMVHPRSGYFESSRYTMKALQKMSQERFPLSENICDLAEIPPPDYVKRQPVIELSQDCTTNILDEWPADPCNDLDQSQWEALHHILTKKLAVIQGPPGTGKTHVSVSALKILLSNMKTGDPPIIISAQTNHALDQLLSHVAEFEPDYIRLGGRSGDEAIRKRTLYEVRQTTSAPALVGGLFTAAKRKLQHLIEQIVKLLEPFAVAREDRPFPARIFLESGILTRPQYDSLEENASGWVDSSTDQPQEPMALWLGDSKVDFRVVYEDEPFDVEEEEMDREYEQLKELEAEMGPDEDVETLKGFFIPLKDGCIGKQISGISTKYVENELARRDLTKVPQRLRGLVYNILCKRLKSKILTSFCELLRAYKSAVNDLQIGKWERDLVTLQDAKIVGVTTTGLSKYRTLLSCLKPKIIMIEEAAEVIEAPVAVSCVESLQHLILVGDHKQLQGHCTVADLEGPPFFLNMSMFERLVRNGIDFRTLTLQRRMVPEIRRLLHPLYEKLDDHPSVKELARLPGMGGIRTYFFNHSWPENSDSLFSKYNVNEAHMVVGFFIHLLYNGVDVKNITVLTFYNGQRKKILKLLRSNNYIQGQYVKVVTVDAYQGEENDIVLLSLVRSNPDDKIGFLSVANRVCVALSRARRGLFFFGNGDILARVDPLWWEVLQILGKSGGDGSPLVSYGLPLTCEKHGRRTIVKNVADWDGLNGGCDLPCGETMDCGHECKLRCHIFSHGQVRCSQPCARQLDCGHKCRERCSSPICRCDCQRHTSQQAQSDSELRQGLAGLTLTGHPPGAWTDIIRRRDRELAPMAVERNLIDTTDPPAMEERQDAMRKRYVQFYSHEVKEDETTTVNLLD